MSAFVFTGVRLRIAGVFYFSVILFADLRIFFYLCQSNTAMKILNREKIGEFITNHANSKKALLRWLEIMEVAEFSNHNELKAIFPSADYVGGGRYVFNIKGNNFRLIAIIVFVGGLAEIRFIGTHAEYDKIIDIENI